MAETENKKMIEVPQILLSAVDEKDDGVEKLKVELEIDGVNISRMPSNFKLEGYFYYPFSCPVPSYDLIPKTLLKLKIWLIKDRPMPAVVPEDAGGKRTDKHLEACVYAAYTCYPFHPPGSREQFITLIHAITFVFVDDIVEFIVKTDAENSSQFLKEIEGTLLEILEGSRKENISFIMEKAGNLASSLKYPNLNYYYSLVYRLHKRMKKWLPVYKSDREPTIRCLRKYFESFKWIIAENNGQKISLNVFRQIRRFDGNAGAAIELSAETLDLVLSPLHRSSFGFQTYIDCYSQAILFINDIMGLAHELKSFESCPQHGTNLVLKYYKLGYSIEEAFSKAIGVVNELLEDIYSIGNILTQNIFPGDEIMNKFVKITRATTRGIYEYQKMSQFRYGSSTPKPPHSEERVN